MTPQGIQQGRENPQYTYNFNFNYTNPHPVGEYVPQQHLYQQQNQFNNDTPIRADFLNTRATSSSNITPNYENNPPKYFGNRSMSFNNMQQNPQHQMRGPRYEYIITKVSFTQPYGYTGVSPENKENYANPSTDLRHELQGERHIFNTNPSKNFNQHGYNDFASRFGMDYVNMSDDKLGEYCLDIVKDQSGCRFLQRKIEENGKFADDVLFPNVFFCLIGRFPKNS